MKNIATTAALVAALALASSAHATQLVQNGNFASTTNGLGQIDYDGITGVTGWSTTHNYGYNFVMNVAHVTVNSQYGGLSLWDASNSNNGWTTGQSPNGDNFMALDGGYDVAPLTQTITGLTANKTYRLTFEYAFGQQAGFDGATVQFLNGSLGGSTFATPSFDVADKGFSGWQTYTGTVTATGTSELLSFLSHGNLPDPPFALLTDVSLTSAVPEPATWAMMIVGLGAMGAAARRRRQAIAIA